MRKVLLRVLEAICVCLYIHTTGNIYIVFGCVGVYLLAILAVVYMNKQKAARIRKKVLDCKENRRLCISILSTYRADGMIDFYRRKECIIVLCITLFLYIGAVLFGYSNIYFFVSMFLFNFDALWVVVCVRCKIENNLLRENRNAYNFLV